MINNLKTNLVLPSILLISFIIPDICGTTIPPNTLLAEAIPSKESKIIGGSAISITEANYQASLRLVSSEKSSGFGYGHICGGSIITQRAILTAAHCVVNSNTNPISERSAGEFRVVVGSTNLYIKDVNMLQYYVQEIAKNSDYDPATLVNDIAVIFINGYIPWNWPTAKSIDLNALQVAADTKCKISGWGKTESGRISSTLLAATVPIISYQQCDNAYGRVPEGMICAGYMAAGGIDACQGDSGGPLACNGNLVGVVSWGVGCAQPENPGVYTNVSLYRNWIVNVNNTFNYTLYRNSAIDLRCSYTNILLTLSMFICYYLF